jgi:hypothetical protein
MQEQDNRGAMAGAELTSLTIQVSADLYRAFQRCALILANETAKSRREIMDEMVRDFLIKHGC